MKKDPTYELKICFSESLDPNKVEQTKSELKAWLTGIGEESFVEGIIDDLDLDFNYENSSSDEYQRLQGEKTPIIIYKYSEENILSLKEKINTTFKDKVITSITTLDTEVWQEGWKDSFKPFLTKYLAIFPPWDVPESKESHLPVEIEPGMAFGTGQHATTKLCLEKMEEIIKEAKDKNILTDNFSMIDVGTGSGILAIGAKKLGIEKIIGTDIDCDAIISAKNNAKRNNVEIEFFEASVPPKEAHGTFQLVVANILAVVLKKILPDLVKIIAPKPNPGKLILSGLLIEERQYFIDECRKFGLEEIEYEQKEDWCCIVFQEKK